MVRPLPATREERQAVVRSGFNAKTHFNIIETVRNQIAYARKGISDLGIKPDFLNILEKRLENKTTAGEYVARLWQTRFNGSIEQTLPGGSRRHLGKDKEQPAYFLVVASSR